MQNFQERIQKIRDLCQENAVPKEILNELDTLQSSLSQAAIGDEAEISVQFSLYPIRQAKITPAIEKAFQVLNRYDLLIKPGAMSTMIIGKAGDVWRGLEDVFKASASEGDVVMTLTVSNACPKEV